MYWTDHTGTEVPTDQDHQNLEMNNTVSLEGCPIGIRLRVFIAPQCHKQIRAEEKGESLTN
ncbi:hypothetical protein BRADI_4g06691v3 [Brachypodium distachyon]|uniref:Uncharacterized protein n=1 Tax=Brachypodium distachyon TaxID=15368 RepID=A0A2K2CKV7_BRADI|nr:hypothetical protein BRADI_4g06691v3 [Brachypodium distachyon]